jgi:hypothetical protein
MDWLRQLIQAWHVLLAFPDGDATTEGANLVWTTAHLRAVILPSGAVECEGMNGALVETAMIAQNIWFEEGFLFLD